MNRVDSGSVLGHGTCEDGGVCRSEGSACTGVAKGDCGAPSCLPSDWPITVQIANIHITPLIGDAGTQPVITGLLNGMEMVYCSCGRHQGVLVKRNFPEKTAYV